MTIITTQHLKDCNFYKEGIKFFKRNFPKKLFPDGLDLSKIEVKGDHRYYFEWLNNLPTLEYDNGKVIKKIYPSGSYIAYEYDTKGNLVKQTLPNEMILHYKYDNNDNLIEEIFTDGYVRYEYNTQNKIIAEIFTSAFVNESCTIYEYNAQGNCIQKIYSSGRICHYEYNAQGNCIQKVINNGDYFYKYDIQGNLVKEILSDGSSYHYEYDKRGNLIKTLDSNGCISNESIFKYDELGRLIQVDDCFITYPS